MSSILKRRLPSGRIAWQIDYRDASSRKRRRSQFLDKGKAEQFFAKVVKEERQARPLTINTNVTVSEYSTRWLTAIVGTVSQKTLVSYAQLIRLYILPVIGDLRLLDLHSQLIGNTLTSWAQAGRAPNTVRLVRATLSAMLADAVDEGILGINPVRDAGGRRHRRLALRQARENQTKRIRALSRQQLDTFLKATKNDGLVYYALFSLMAESGGPRPGEALALPWNRVNLRDGVAEIIATKTHTTRFIHLAPRTVKLLRRLRANAARLALREGRELDGMAFVNSNGQPIDQSRLNKRMKRALTRAGLSSNHSIYDMRHSWATIQLAEGVPITYIASQLGHKTPETTWRWYARWIPGERPLTSTVPAAVAKKRKRKT